MLKRRDCPIGTGNIREMAWRKIESLYLPRTRNLRSSCRFLISRKKRDLQDKVIRNSKMTFHRKKVAFRWIKNQHHLREPKNKAVKEDLETEATMTQLGKFNLRRWLLEATETLFEERESGKRVNRKIRISLQLIHVIMIEEARKTQTIVF